MLQSIFYRKEKHFSFQLSKESMMETPPKLTMPMLKSMIFWILYLALAATSFLFVQETIDEYLTGKTDYHHSQIPITTQDIPTITTCFEHKDDLKYGTHFNVGLWFNSSLRSNTFKPLAEGKNLLTNSDNITHQLVLKNLVVNRSSQ